jgi:hypothetical protein
VRSPRIRSPPQPEPSPPAPAGPAPSPPYRRAEARVAAFKAAEALLPPERREWPAVQPLEERLGDLDSLRLAVLRRLFQVPAPNLEALALKLELVVADQAWELERGEACLAAMADDARRLAGSSGWQTADATSS